MANIVVVKVRTDQNFIDTAVQTAIDGVANVDKSKVPTHSILPLSGDTCVVLVCVPTT